VTTSPAFTPDGQRLGFIRFHAKADTETIESMDLTGAGARVIGGHLADTDPNVSPDGLTVTFVRRPKGGKRQALFAIGIDGSGLRRLTPDDFEVAIKRDWSPDGRRIALTTNADFVRPHSSANLGRSARTAAASGGSPTSPAARSLGATRSRAPIRPTARTSRCASSATIAAASPSWTAMAAICACSPRGPPPSRGSSTGARAADPGRRAAMTRRRRRAPLSACRTCTGP